MAKQKSVDIDARSLILGAPIRRLGEFEVPLWVDGREIDDKLRVLVKKIQRK